MTGYYTNYTPRVDEVAEKYLFNESFNDPEPFGTYRISSKSRTFVFDENRFFKCYSENLHLYQSGSKPDTMEVDFNWSGGDYISAFMLRVNITGLFDPSGRPQVFLGIHSPFVPMNPIFSGHAIRAGYRYEFQVQLEKEEHLLPPPYQTNCRDNGPSKDVKSFTKPNSYQVCLEMCRSEHSKQKYGCDLGSTMVFLTSDLCMEDMEEYKISPESESELDKKRLNCMQNCKPECLKLHYKYELAERQFRHHEAIQYFGLSYIEFSVKNTEVTVLRHVPLYGSAELFSHIGGLLGCWLGISVFTLLDIIQKFLWKIINWKLKLKLDKEQDRAPSENLD